MKLDLSHCRTDRSIYDAVWAAINECKESLVSPEGVSFHLVANGPIADLLRPSDSRFEGKLANGWNYLGISNREIFFWINTNTILIKIRLCAQCGDWYGERALWLINMPAMYYVFNCWKNDRIDRLLVPTSPFFDSFPFDAFYIPDGIQLHRDFDPQEGF